MVFLGILVQGLEILGFHRFASRSLKILCHLLKPVGTLSTRNIRQALEFSKNEGGIPVNSGRGLEALDFHELA